MKKIVIVIAFIVSSQSVALAQEASSQTDISAQEQRLTAERSLIEAQRQLLDTRRQLIVAEQSLASQRLEPFSEFAGSGDQSFGTNGGTMDAAILAALSVHEVARKTYDEVSEVETDGRILLLSNDSDFAFQNLITFRSEVSSLVSLYRSAYTLIPQHAVPDGCQIGANTLSAGTLGFIGAALGLAQSDVTVTGIEVKVENEYLISSLVALAPDRFLLPDDMMLPSSTPDELSFLMNVIRRCRSNEFVALAAASNDEQSNAMTAAIAAADSLMQSVHAVSNNTTRLNEIARQAYIAQETDYVLTVNLERSGGTLYDRNNLLTVFGAPALSISAGVISSYRLIEYNEGAIHRAGTVICRTRPTNIGAAASLQSRDINCHTLSGRSTTDG